MMKYTLPGFILLLVNLTAVNAAEITTCVMDTTIKKNPRVYFFPVTSTKLRCDHNTSSASATLGELYQDNWRLIQAINPIEFKQKDKSTGFTPVLLYLERTIVPVKSKLGKTTTRPVIDSDDVTADTTGEGTQKSGGLFNWFKKGDAQQETEGE